MGLLSKAAILAAEDLPTREIAVPEWGGSVLIRAMSGADRDAFEAEQMQAKRDGFVEIPNLRARYVSACIVDETGARMFDDAEVAKLGAKSVAALDRVFSAIIQLNKLDPADIEAEAKN